MASSQQPMQGKVCLITGATSGIGAATAMELARQGATVVIVSRSPERCAATVAAIKQETGNSNVDYLTADLASQQSVRDLAQQFKSKYPRLDVLVNNVGLLVNSKEKSKEGIAQTFALNHLGPFLLTNLLLDTLKASAPARIINLSSGAHFSGTIDLAKMRTSRGLGAYSDSKLANVLFTYELARRLAGTGVTVNAVHPGVVASNFGANNGVFWRRIIRPIMNRFSISNEKGAATSVYLATSPEVADVTGKYFDKKRAVPSAKRSYDTALAKQLWDESASLTGLSPA